jgi:hypothetical protein
MAVLVVFAFVGSGWLWDNVSNNDAVSVILVLIALGAAGAIAFQVLKIGSLPLGAKAGIGIVVVALGVLAAVELVGIDLGESSAEVPTLLFGLGAIALVNEPRGVVYDIVNRQRLRQFKEAERRDEEAAAQALVTATAGATA